MAPQLTEDEIDDLIYFARVGENVELTETITALADREKVSPAEVLVAAKDEGKSTTLHMASGNGNIGELYCGTASSLKIWNLDPVIISWGLGG